MKRANAWFGRRQRLVAAVALVVPLVWMGLRNLNSLSLSRRLAAVILRAAVVLILAALLAREERTRALLDAIAALPAKQRAAAQHA